MNLTVDTIDGRLNDLVDEVARLTGENYVIAMCRALEERRDRLVTPRTGQILRLSLEISEEIPGREGAPTRDRGA
jgi:hypothetical protein